MSSAAHGRTNSISVLPLSQINPLPAPLALKNGHTLKQKTSLIFSGELCPQLISKNEFEKLVAEPMDGGGGVARGSPRG